jgi:GTP pyrophosphokinase
MEFQIRTREMDDEAKYGVAAHWYYKRPYGDRNIPEWIKGIIKARQIYEKSSGLVDKIDLNALTDDIFCYTPRGDIIELPRGSTPVDFAYAVHTELGHYCKSAMINDSPRSLDFTLKNNDIVEIVKKFKKQPLKNWLEFVKTQRAKDSIRQFYNRR